MVCLLPCKLGELLGGPCAPYLLCREVEWVEGLVRNGRPDAVQPAPLLLPATQRRGCWELQERDTLPPP